MSTDPTTHIEENEAFARKQNSEVYLKTLWAGLDDLCGGAEAGSSTERLAFQVMGELRQLAFLLGYELPESSLASGSMGRRL